MFYKLKCIKMNNFLAYLVNCLDVESPWTSVTEHSGNIKGEYDLLYNVERTKGKTKERLLLLFLEDRLEIVRYDIAPF